MKVVNADTPLLAVPQQGEKIQGKKGTLGVVVGFGWLSDNETPTMRPVVLVAIKGGIISVVPAEVANVLTSEDTLVKSPLS